MLTNANLKQLRKESGEADARLALVFRALADPGRFRIFKLLSQHRDLCVSELARVVGMSLPAASQHLKVLDMAGVLEKERTGQTICYCVKKNDPVVQSLIKFIKSVE